MVLDFQVNQTAHTWQCFRGEVWTAGWPLWWFSSQRNACWRGWARFVWWRTAVHPVCSSPVTVPSKQTRHTAVHLDCSSPVTVPSKQTWHTAVHLDCSSPVTVPSKQTWHTAIHLDCSSPVTVPTSLGLQLSIQLVLYFMCYTANQTVMDYSYPSRLFFTCYIANQTVLEYSCPSSLFFTSPVTVPTNQDTNSPIYLYNIPWTTKRKKRENDVFPLHILHEYSQPGLPANVQTCAQALILITDPKHSQTQKLIHVLIVLTLLRSTHLQDISKATLTQCTDTQTSTGLPTFGTSPKPPLPSVHTDLYRSTHLQDITKTTLAQCIYTQTCTGLPIFRTSPKPPLPSVHTHRPVQVYPPSAHCQSHPCPASIQTSTGLPTFGTSPKPPLPDVHTHRPVQVYPPSAHSQSHPCPACIKTSTGLPTFRTSPKPPLPSVHTTWNSWVSRDLPFLSMDVLYSIRSLSSSLPTSLLWSPGHRQQRKAWSGLGQQQCFVVLFTQNWASENYFSFFLWTNWWPALATTVLQFFAQHACSFANSTKMSILHLCFVSWGTLKDSTQCQHVQWDLINPGNLVPQRICLYLWIFRQKSCRVFTTAKWPDKLW